MCTLIFLRSQRENLNFINLNFNSWQA